MKSNTISEMTAGEPRQDKRDQFTLCGYCGKARNLNIVELQCSTCLQYHHESCISYQLGKLVPFLTNYMFSCRTCSSTGLETFRKLQAQSSQMCVSALANLQQTAAKQDGRTMFSMVDEIVPWIDLHWEALTTMARRSTHSWKQTIHRTLSKDTGTLFVCQEADDDDGDDHGDGRGAKAALPRYGLKQSDLSLIRPNYQLIKQRQTDGLKNRGPKRKIQETASAAKKARSEGVVQKLHGYPMDHPFNKDGYRYILTEPDPHAPFRQEFDESSDSNSRPIPGWLHRPQCPSTVLLALHDRSPCLRVSDDRLSVTGDRGYCLLRATHCVRAGTWYWEAQFTRQPDGAHVRIGWAQPLANLSAPLGYDKFGYSWRSRKGTAFHDARGKHFSDGFGQGDVLGLLIHIPEKSVANQLPCSYKDRPLIKWKSHLYFEDKDDVTGSEAGLHPVAGAYIDVYKNGVHQGRPFSNIYGGDYYPAISLYKSAVVTANFGPKFQFLPANVDFRPVSDRAEEHTVQQAMADIAWLTEHEGKLSIDS